MSALAAVGVAACEEFAVLPEDQDAVRRAFVNDGIHALEFRVQRSGPDGTVLRFEARSRDAVPSGTSGGAER